MDPMLLGETIATYPANESYTGFWMPAGGSEGIAAVETFYVSAASLFTVKFWTKSSDEADSAVTTALASKVIDSTTPGIFKMDVSGAKDLVRYTIEAGESTAGVMHFQLCQPLWSPN